MTDLPDPYAVAPRKPLTPRQRLQMFLEHKGICCLCGQKIDGVREKWIDEHELALWLGGTEDAGRLNNLENRGPAHERCAKSKTAREATDRAKGRKAAERHLGAHRPKRPTEYTRLKHKFKRTVDGKVVPRFQTNEAAE